VYTDTLINVCGYDSIITINLTIDPSQSIIEQDTLSMVSCVDYTWEQTGLIYNETGYYIDSFHHDEGCLEVKVLDLTTSSFHAEVTAIGTNVLRANVENAGYIWLKCENGNYSVVPGEFGQDFSPSDDGDYAVVITKNFCSDTSTCEFMLKVTENQNDMNLALYPNPSNGEFILQTIHVGAHFNVCSIDGKMLVAGELIKKNKTELDFSDLDKGTYFIEVYDGKSRGKQLFIVQ
jgi:hypothetical protein